MKPVPPFVLVPLLVLAPSSQGATLFSEPFDSEATAKVKLQQQTDTAISYVDYSSFVRQAPGAGGTLTVGLPEAPNRIPGSLPTRGVVLSALYGSSQRAINLLAADAPGGAAVSFSGNYRMSFDMWLSLDPAATASSAGTTESGLWMIGTSGAGVISRANRASGNGTWGWLTTEGGAGAGANAGDAVLWVDATNPFLLENLTAPTQFTAAFPQGAPLPNTPNNQWTAVEVVVVGTRVVVRLNGAKFFDHDPGTVGGFAGLGYEDLFNTSTTFSLNWQFGVFDNFAVESIPDLPSLEVEPALGFPKATLPGEAPTADFNVLNNGFSDFSILSATIDGAHASQFSLNPALPLVVNQGSSQPLTVTFTPAIPNGLKVARLVLTTNDPNAPTISVPLQARREILTVEGSLTTAVPTVLTEGGTSNGEITVTNLSLGSVDLTGATVTGANGPEFSVTTAFPVTIPSGGATTLAVRFDPTGAGGVKTASIALATTDPGSPTLTIPVRGRYSFGPPLLAHFRLDDTAGTSLIDSSSSAVNATLHVREAPFGFNSPSLLPTGAGSACAFTPADATTSGNFAVAPLAHLPTVSYSLWIRPEADAGNRVLLHRSSVFTTTGTLHSLFLTESGKLTFAVNSVTAVESTDGAIVDGETYHVVVTHRDDDGFENDTAQRTALYVDGVSVAEAPDGPGYTDYLPNSAAEGLYIASATGAGAGYRGLIDDLQVYSIELTPGQVAGMFAQPGRTAFELAPASFGITSVQVDRTAGTVTLTWNSEAGAVYAIAQSTTLQQWGDVTGLDNIVATGASTTRTIPGIPPTATESYYRVRLVAVP